MNENYTCYHIQPIEVAGRTYNGVYEPNGGQALLGKVFSRFDGVSQYVQPLIGAEGKVIPAPSNWREYVIERLHEA